MFDSSRNFNAPAAQELVPSAIIEAARSTAYIEAPGGFRSDGSPATKTGSGFFVRDDGLLATDYHVVRFAQQGSIAVYTSDGRMRRANIVTLSPTNDLAILQVQPQHQFERFPVARLGSSATAANEKLTAVGFLDGNILAAPGKYHDARPLSSYNIMDGLLPGEDANRTVMVTDSKVRPGYSGGPLFRNDGTVAGIVDMSGEAMGRTISTPVEELLNLLHQGPSYPTPLSARWQNANPFALSSSRSLNLGSMAGIQRSDTLLALAASSPVVNPSWVDRLVMRWRGH